MAGHFNEPVTLEAVRPLNTGFECRIRLEDGSLEETIISDEEAQALLGITQLVAAPRLIMVDRENLRLLVESYRIRMAYAHDPHFAVSVPDIRTLHYQIEAVYQR